MVTLRKAAGILLFRSDGTFLLQHRDKHISRFPDHWGFFGGGIEDCETPEEAMLRETAEELGIRVINYTLALEHHVSDQYGIPGHIWIYKAPFEAQGPIILGEGQGMGWFSPKDLESLKMIPHDREAILAICYSSFR